MKLRDKDYDISFVLDTDRMGPKRRVAKGVDAAVWAAGGKNRREGAQEPQTENSLTTIANALQDLREQQARLNSWLDSIEDSRGPTLLGQPAQVPLPGPLTAQMPQMVATASAGSAMVSAGLGGGVKPCTQDHR